MGSLCKYLQILNSAPLESILIFQNSITDIYRITSKLWRR
jgi:hypothetical protein